MRNSSLITTLVHRPLASTGFRLLGIGLALFYVAALSTGCYVFRDFDPPPDRMDASVDAEPGSPDARDGTDPTDTKRRGPPDTRGPDQSKGDGDAVTTPDAADDSASDCVAVGAPNEAQHYCRETGSTCGNITVIDDCGAAHNVNCGTCQDGATCLGDATTFPRECACDCEIGGKCFAAGAVKSDNACLVCDPSASRTQWSPEVDKSCGGTPSCSCNQRGSCVKANGNQC